MKRLIQLILFLFLIILIYLFYNKYFEEEVKITKNEIKALNDTKDDELENNIIKNLKYDINIQGDNSYQITSELSEITNQGKAEIVIMKKVTAILTDKKNSQLKIFSDNAVYNNQNHNTNFENNIRIEYLDNIIYAEKMNLNFEDNSISIFENVRYNSPSSTLKTDNININLNTRKISIFMNNTNDNVVITADK